MSNHSTPRRAAKKGIKKAANVSLNKKLLDEAKILDLNISQIAEIALEQAVAKEQERLWKEESLEALESSNKWVEKHGLPLEKYRPF